jgi:hypothetical protein
MTRISGEADVHSWTVMVEAHHKFAFNVFGPVPTIQCMLDIEFLALWQVNRIIYLHSLLR